MFTSLLVKFTYSKVPRFLGLPFTNTYTILVMFDTAAPIPHYMVAKWSCSTFYQKKAENSFLPKANGKLNALERLLLSLFRIFVKVDEM